MNTIFKMLYITYLFNFGEEVKTVQVCKEAQVNMSEDRITLTIGDRVFSEKVLVRQPNYIHTYENTSYMIKEDSTVIYQGMINDSSIMRIEMRKEECPLQ